MAGGYDPQNRENVAHFAELEQQCEDLELRQHVTFLKSPDNTAKTALLRHATALLYTPDREHFGGCFFFFFGSVGYILGFFFGVWWIS